MAMKRKFAQDNDAVSQGSGSSQSFETSAEWPWETIPVEHENAEMVCCAPQHDSESRPEDALPPAEPMEIDDVEDTPSTSSSPASGNHQYYSSSPLRPASTLPSSPPQPPNPTPNMSLDQLIRATARSRTSPVCTEAVERLLIPPIPRWQQYPDEYILQTIKWVKEVHIGKILINGKEYDKTRLEPIRPLKKQHVEICGILSDWSRTRAYAEKLNAPDVSTQTLRTYYKWNLEHLDHIRTRLASPKDPGSSRLHDASYERGIIAFLERCEELLKNRGGFVPTPWQRDTVALLRLRWADQQRGWTGLRPEEVEAEEVEVEEIDEGDSMSVASSDATIDEEPAMSAARSIRYLHQKRERRLFRDLAGIGGVFDA